MIACAPGWHDVARADNAYSRLVAWLKILLPVAALAILSTLFLLSRSIDPMQAVPFSQSDVDELLREPRITAPNYAGVTEDGTAITLSAETARPDPAEPARVSAAKLRATIETPDGVATNITADQGMIDGTAGQVSLQGAVQLTSGLGYLVNTDGLSMALDQTGLETHGTLRAVGPFGTITAGQMLLRLDQSTGTYVLVFNGGVKLLYVPED